MKTRFPLTRFLLATLSLALFAPLGAQTPVPPPSELALPQFDDGMPSRGPLRRHLWFHNTWMQRRTLFAKNFDANKGALVFLGDSITQGWGEDFTKRFPGVHIANRGIGGDTTLGILLRLERDVLALNPSGIVLLIGTNDLSDGARADIITGNVKILLERIKGRFPAIPIVLCEVFPSSPKMQRDPVFIKELNSSLRALVKGDPQIRVLDTWTLFAGPDENAKLEEMPDLLHLNDAGYAKWTAALRPVLATLGYMDTAPDEFKIEPGFTSLFNGKDLTGWGYRPTSAADRESAKNWQARDPNAAAWPFVDEAVNFDGLTASPDGRYSAVNGRLVVNFPPEGRKIQQLWTKQEFGTDFELRLEFRATPNADSGVYVRGPQLQCRDYSLAGPWKDLPNYRQQDWNEIVVVVKGSEMTATCNGDSLPADLKLPASGPIGLEGDRGQMEYRRIRIKQL
jgi:lysophospholipase L1-like esterase